MQDNWTTEELRASVKAYLSMLKQHRDGEKFVKKEWYRKLSSQFDRTEKAFEYRAQNISHVLSLLGRQWLPGLLPAKNVGHKVTAQIESILADLEGFDCSGVAEFEARVQNLRKRKRGAKPCGNENPKRSSRSSSEFVRDPSVKAWVLEHAHGCCEGCELPASFNNSINEPYLEVHHARHLADGGTDTITNAVALCPNCHRALHYARDRVERVFILYGKIDRLVVE